MIKFACYTLLIVSLFSCQYKSGSGDIVTETRKLKDFKKLNVSGGFEVEVKKGNAFNVSVEADDNIIGDIETIVENDQLKIFLENGFNYRDIHMKIFITAPFLEKINSAASADIKLDDEMDSDNAISLNASSGSSIKGAVIAPDISVDASSGAEVNVTGRTKNLDVQVSSGATVNAADLLSENTTAKTSSGATAKVHASVKLDAKASSGGSINYRGEANAVVKENSGGSITKVN
jgi:Putative auto-transporter adhesin, head GIN domain